MPNLVSFFILSTLMEKRIFCNVVKQAAGTFWLLFWNMLHNVLGPEFTYLIILQQLSFTIMFLRLH